MKKLFWVSITSAVLIAVFAFLLGRFVFPNTALSDLPRPEVSEGQRGELGIDKNINESTIDSYLGRNDSIYRDMRMLIDPANYGAIGGDSYLTGFVNGFEVVSLPYLVNVTLPEAVGETYSGKTLFRKHSDGKYTANYRESMDILEALFPKYKKIFLMCGGGGYAGMTKELLVALGWDADKIYNVGGYWYYEGKNNVEVKRILSNGEVTYDFYKVLYHDINFKGLTELSPGEVIEISAEDYAKIINSKRSFLLFVDQDGCDTADRMREFTQKYIKETRAQVYKIMFAEMKKTALHDLVKYYPSFVVVKDGEVMKFLRADSDEDKDFYNDYNEFKRFVEN